MQGQTGPYVQNAFVRIQSVLRRNLEKIGSYEAYEAPNEFELNLLKDLSEFPNLVKEAAESLDPSAIANYSYNLAKTYHRFYHEVRILKAESDAARSFRLELSKVVARVLEDAMNLLGIEMPERM